MPKKHRNRKGRTSHQGRFAKIPSVSIPRSSFDRSCGLKTTFNAGFLVPIFVDEALPGDTMSLKATYFGRLATPIHPVFENMYIDTFFFAVPNRLLWDNWQKFNGEQDNPNDSTSFEIPRMSPNAVSYGAESIYDYMGLPVLATNQEPNALHMRAYNLIFKEWFRSQDLINSPAINKGDGPDPIGDYKLLRRGKRHDYFTSCLPWPQKGQEVTLPLGLTAPVVPTTTGSTVPLFNVGTQTDSALEGTADSPNVNWAKGVAGNTNDATWSYSGLETDLSNATAATINQMREAFQLQRMNERDARGGSRYTEILRSHFGVVSDDARLQRPEYLGGGKSIISINPVAQTSETVLSPQANLAAFGTLAGGAGFSKSFTEHCVIIGLACMRADLNYQQGIERMWSRRTRYDYYWPALAHLGEQEVLNREIYWQSGPNPVNDQVFGYQERYAEYRYKPSRVTGKMRSETAQTLDSWHLAQNFSSLPVLNESFIEEDPPVARIQAVENESHILFDAFFQYRCARPMPTYSVPGMIDHF